jgi:plasmid stabilization system protein ParE
MGYPVVLTPQAQEDLQSIVRFISFDSPERARAFGNLLIDCALSLAEFPEMGRMVPEIGDPAVREIVEKPYRIIYEVFRLPTAVYILRLWHSSRGNPEIRRG